MTPIEALKLDIEHGKQNVAKAERALARFVEDAEARILEAKTSIDRQKAEIEARQAIVDQAEKEAAEKDEAKTE